MELEGPGVKDLLLEAVADVYGTMEVRVVVVVAVEVDGDDDEVEVARVGVDVFVAVGARIGAADAKALALEVESVQFGGNDSNHSTVERWFGIGDHDTITLLLVMSSFASQIQKWDYPKRKLLQLHSLCYASSCFSCHLP